MHSQDRRWRVPFAAAALVLGSSLAILLGTTVALNRLTGESVQWMALQIDWSSSNTCSSMFSLVGVTILWWIIVRFAFQARWRENIRMHELTGDVGAMPLATLQPVPQTTQVWTSEPFILRWTNGASITATQDGLLWQRPKKHDVSIAWNQARLLEMREVGLANRPKKDETFEHCYCLYDSLTKYIEWTDAPQGRVAGEHLSWEQKDHLQQELLAIVSTRANLPLRVIPDRRSTRQKMTFRSKISLVGIAFGLFLAAFPLITGILALTAPLTTSFVINLCVAIVYGGIGLVILGLMAKGLIEVARPPAPKPAPPSVTLPFAPSGATHDSGVAIRFGERLRDRLIAVSLLIVSLVTTSIS